MLDELYNILYSDKGIIIFYIVNIFILLLLIYLFVNARINGKKWLKINDYLGSITNTINSVRYGDLTKKIDKA